MTTSLAFLSPVLVKAALEGRLPRGIGATHLCDARRVVAATPDALPEPLNAALRSNLSHQTASLFPRKKDSGPENPGAGNCTGCWRGDPETTRPRAAPQNAGRLQFSQTTCQARSHFERVSISQEKLFQPRDGRVKYAISLFWRQRLKAATPVSD
jgi:hypothetical protein